MYLHIVAFAFLLILGQTGASEPASVSELMAEVRSGANYGARIRALDSAIAIGGVDERISTVKMLDKLVDDYHVDSLAELSSAEQRRRADGVSIFQYFLDRHVQIYGGQDGARKALLDLLKKVAADEGSGIPGATRVKCYELLMEYAAGESARKAYALEMVEREALGVGYWAVSYLKASVRFDTEMHLRFRQILRTSLEKGKPNILALFVLGHVGDAKILQDLEQFAAETTDLNRRFMPKRRYGK